MIKVAHISNTDFFFDKLMLNKLNGLKKLGYQIDIISPDGKYVQGIREKGYNYHTIHLNRNINVRDDLLTIKQIFSIIKQEKYDIVHTHSAKAGITGRIAAKLAGVPIIIHTTHGLPFYAGMPKFKYYSYLMIEKFAALFTDALLSQNQEDISYMKKYRFANIDRIFFEGNGVNINMLRAISKNTNIEQKRDELGITNKQVVIGYFARFEEVKGHKYFIDAIEELVKRQPNIICLLAGSGELETKVKDYVTSKGLDPYFAFLGFREDIIEILTVVDIVVLASEKEGIPRILMEAMCLGKPVVATDVLGTKELVVDNTTGYLVPYKDYHSLQEKIFHLINNRETYELFSVESQKRIENLFDENRVVERIDFVYKMLLAEKGYRICHIE